MNSSLSSNQLNFHPTGIKKNENPFAIILRSHPKPNILKMCEVSGEIECCNHFAYWTFIQLIGERIERLLFSIETAIDRLFVVRNDTMSTNCSLSWQVTVRQHSRFLWLQTERAIVESFGHDSVSILWLSFNWFCSSHSKCTSDEMLIRRSPCSLANQF